MKLRSGLFFSRTCLCELVPPGQQATLCSMTLHRVFRVDSEDVSEWCREAQVARERKTWTQPNQPHPWILVFAFDLLHRFRSSSSFANPPPRPQRFHIQNPHKEREKSKRAKPRQPQNK